MLKKGKIKGRGSYSSIDNKRINKTKREKSYCRLTTLPQL
jgi:hypothetical protein